MPDKIIAYFDGFQVCIAEVEPTEHDVFPHAEYIRAEPVNRQMLYVLTELYAVVKGECPSLLNEDSGGDAELDMQIQDVITAAEQQLASGLNLDDGLNGTKNSTVFIPRDVLYRIVNTTAKYLSVTAIQLALKPYVKGGE